VLIERLLVTPSAFHTGLSANPADGMIADIHAPEKNFE